MCIYTLKKPLKVKNINKEFLKGVRDSTERLKISRLRRKGYRLGHVMLHTGRI